MDISYGSMGEQLAEKYLVSKNYYILAKNYHSKFGDIDIIASDGSSIVFIEVKTRTQNQYGTALEAITKNKLENIIKTSHLYLEQRNMHGHPYRYDAIEIILKASDKPIINHLLNIAF